MAMTQAPGWFPDPAGGSGQRWWDGYQWTSRVQHTPPAGRPLLSKQGLRRQRWIALGVVVAILLLVGVAVALSPEKKGGGRNYYVLKDDGTGIGYIYTVGSGWNCLYNSSAFACAGGTGRARSVGSSHRGQYDVAGQFDSDSDELVVVFDPVRWRCALTKVDGAIGCDLR